MTPTRSRHEISPGTIVVVGKDQVTSDLAGDAVILHVRSGRCYELVQVGARIWNMISAPRRVSDIRDAIVQAYDVSMDRCEADVVALVEELAEQGLVDVLPAMPQEPEASSPA